MRQSSISLFLLFIILLGCFSDEGDPTPSLTFATEGTLTCYLGSPCWNPVQSSIVEGIKLPDGTMILQSGAISISSRNPDVADYGSGGSFITKKVGQTTIIAVQEASRGYNAKAKTSFKLIVKPELDDLPSLSWYQEQFYDVSQPFYRGIGDSIQNHLISTIPNGGAITYLSSNPSVATVNSNGLVKVLSLGEAIITGTQKEKTGVNLSTSLTFKVKVDPRSIILFTNGSPYTCTMWDGKTYSNRWLTNMSGGGGMTLYVDTYFAGINYIGDIIDLRKPGKTTVKVVQEAKYGVHSRSEASYELIILAPKPDLQFAKGTSYKCSLVNGGCKNEITTMFDYQSQITYASSDGSIATVNNQGIITPVQVGQTTISAYFPEIPGKYQADTATYALTVIDYPFPDLGWSNCFGNNCQTSCTLSNPSICKVKANTSIPGGGAIVYSSADPSIATIDGAGQITPVKVGRTTITATQLEVPGVNGSVSTTITLYIYQN